LPTSGFEFFPTTRHETPRNLGISVQFGLFGKSCGLLLCVGITANELVLK
jgi:hypothetical protein